MIDLPPPVITPLGDQLLGPIDELTIAQYPQCCLSIRYQYSRNYSLFLTEEGALKSGSLEHPTIRPPSDFLAVFYFLELN